MQRNCECAYCKNNLSFDMPDTLLRDILQGNVVLFAGAGISTEGTNANFRTLYDLIMDRLGMTTCQLSFPELMQAFEDKESRHELISIIDNRFRSIGLADDYENIISFYNALSSMPYMSDIVTTNWDTYFEQYCAAKAFVYSSDLPFWNNASRRVLKIHGSIENYGSLVATSSDYDISLKQWRNGLIGSKLKELLVSKTVVFIGYSLTDFNFSHIWDFVRNDLRGLQKKPYIVTPIEDREQRYKKLGLTHLCTDGKFFLKLVKAHAEGTRQCVPDMLYDSALNLMVEVRQFHNYFCSEINFIKLPQAVLTAFYHDGAISICKKLFNSRIRGEYSLIENLHGLSHRIRALLDSFAESDDIFSYSFVLGYWFALQSILVETIADEPDTEQASDLISKYSPFPMYCSSQFTPVHFENIHEYIDSVESETEESIRERAKQYLDKIGVKSQNVVPQYLGYILEDYL